MKKRIHILDELRGLCVVLMVIYHALYTFAGIFGMSWAIKLFWLCSPLEPFFAGIFIALCGVSCRLSKSNRKRGLLLAAVAIAMTVVLLAAMPDQVIWFGVLHCLAVCILLFALLRPLLDRVPPLVGVIVCAVLCALLWTVPTVFGGRFLLWPLPTALLTCKWLFPLGFGYIYSADYFPLIPWVFCFMGGTFLGQWKERLPAWCYKRHLPPLAFAGRHSLIVYLVHQPLIIGITMGVYILMSLLA